MSMGDLWYNTIYVCTCLSLESDFCAYIIHLARSQTDHHPLGILQYIIPISVTKQDYDLASLANNLACMNHSREVNHLLFFYLTSGLVKQPLTLWVTPHHCNVLQFNDFPHGKSLHF